MIWDEKVSMMMITDYWCPVYQYEWDQGKGVKYIKCVVCAEYIYNLATVVATGVGQTLGLRQWRGCQP